jgi:hypothetical protein
MMGLEPTTFCMANASDRSRPFAPVRSNTLFAGLPSKLANAAEPERTPNLAILATGRTHDWRRDPCLRRHVAEEIRESPKIRSRAKTILVAT